jgi:hypothetical protein
MGVVDSGKSAVGYCQLEVNQALSARMKMIEKENVKVREQRQRAALTSDEKVKEKGKPSS